MEFENTNEKGKIITVRYKSVCLGKPSSLDRRVRFLKEAYPWNKKWEFEIRNSQGKGERKVWLYQLDITVGMFRPIYTMEKDEMSGRKGKKERTVGRKEWTDG